MTDKPAAERAIDDQFSIENRRTVITGGTAGIGLGVAKHFVEAGATVVITGRRDDGAEIAESVGASFVRMDVAEDESVERGMAEARSLLGGLDVLILNAGGGAPCGPIDDLDLDSFRRTIEVNFFGVVRGLKFGLPYMGAGGSVIVTSSPGGRQGLGVPGLAAYSTSKSAVDQLVRSGGLELASRGIRMSGVLPGFIKTEIAGDAAAEDSPSWLALLTASGEAKEPADMAPIYHYLASDAGAMLQGSIVSADDGCTAGLSLPLVMKLVGAP